MGDIAMASLRSEDWLYKMFGIDAELLIDHAWGYETCRMSDIKNYHSEEHSLSNGQVLMRNYSFEEALVIVREMTDNLALDLFEKGLVTSSLTLWIAYDHRYEHEASKGTVKLERGSNSSKKSWMQWKIYISGLRTDIPEFEESRCVRTGLLLKIMCSTACLMIQNRPIKNGIYRKQY